jgi:hypothetical protein
MGKSSKRREFSELELKIIKESSGKLTLLDLSIKLGINYTNLSTSLRQQRVPFSPYRTPRVYAKHISSSMIEKTNSKNQKLVTDEHLKEWSYML